MIGKKATLIFFLFVFTIESQIPADSVISVIFIQPNNLKTFFRIARSPLIKVSTTLAWKKTVPEVKTIDIQSSADGSTQKALFYDSGSPRKKPLLLALHSWSEDYKQHFSIPYGIWAVDNDWVFIHPDYRGPFTNPMATGSDFAVSDILDALQYAKKNANIDTTRIYITGFSGGGMATLLMVGRFPHLWAGAAVWVPVYDLVKWYETTRYAVHDYSKHITNSCGGEPVPGTDAAVECLKRSPSSYLKDAKCKGVQVYIATGIQDRFVPPSHSLMAFNDLADPEDRISSSDMDYIDKKHKLPAHLRGQYYDSLYTDVGLKLLLQRKSACVVLKIYNGNHDVVYNAGLYWLSKQSKKR